MIEDAMAENSPSPPAPGRAPGPSARPTPPQAEVVRPGHMPMGEEFDRAKWTLPPMKIVAIGIGVIAVALLVVGFLFRAKPVGKASIDDVTAVQTQSNSVLVAINVSLTNVAEKPLYIHTVKAGLETDKGKWSDDAASIADFERYFQAFPDLRTHAIEPLKPETKIATGGEAKGTVIVSFPVTKEEFDGRKSLSVTVEPYDQRPITITR